MIYKENENKEVALVFSCPGRVEEKAEKPCAGQTGKNLKTLLRLISGREGFPRTRADLIINNAWEKVEYMRRSKRTEATNGEICSESNFERLYRELQGVKLIVSFGDRSKTVISKLISIKSMDVKHVKVIHLSMQAINSKIKLDVEGHKIRKGARDATLKRLTVISNDILQQLSLVRYA